MSEKKKRVPQLRFPGFSGEWEERKLSELATFSKGSGYSKADLTEFGKPIILYGRLYTKYETVISEVDTYVNINSSAIFSEGNEVIVPASGETAEDIARASAVDKKGIILGGDLNIIRPNSEIDQTFLALNISNGSQQQEMMKRAQGKTIVHLHNSDLKEVLLKYPCIDEQTQIGSFFKQLDHLITLHQRKLTHLQIRKKGLLQKMFPKDGELFPELRFPGFTDAWEERKLEDLVDRIKSYSLSRDVETTENTGVRYVHYGDIHMKVADKITNGSSIPNIRSGNYETLQKGDLVLADASEDYQGIATPSVILENTTFQIIAGLHTIALRPKNVDSLFLYYLINTAIFKKYGYRIGTGMKVFGISFANVMKFKSTFPLIEEQQKIGAFFKQLDDSITLYQRKLDHLQTRKKALLQQMFV